jgi:hypothetical protein
VPLLGMPQGPDPATAEKSRPQGPDPATAEKSREKSPPFEWRQQRWTGHRRDSLYGALHATIASGGVRLATDGGAKIAR